LRGARIKVIEHAFPDHHNFDAADFAQMDPSLPILMTEKDAVKCKNLGLKNAWYLSVDAILPAEWEHDLIQRVVRGPATVRQT
jgi:tetraacyldisaccharide 4'-kinase